MIEFGQGQVAVEQGCQALIVADEQQARAGGAAFGEQQLDESCVAAWATLPWRCSARAVRRREKRQGSSTFARTDRNGSRLNCWKM